MCRLTAIWRGVFPICPLALTLAPPLMSARSIGWLSSFVAQCRGELLRLSVLSTTREVNAKHFNKKEEHVDIYVPPKMQYENSCLVICVINHLKRSQSSTQKSNLLSSVMLVQLIGLIPTQNSDIFSVVHSFMSSKRIIPLSFQVLFLFVSKRESEVWDMYVSSFRLCSLIT